MAGKVALGLTTLAVWGILIVSSNEECASSTNTKYIQTTCRAENEAIVDAESLQDYVEVCRHFPLLMKCAVTAIPHCFDFFETNLRMYTHSPSFCALSKEEILELQDIYRKITQMTSPSSDTESPISSPDTTKQDGQGPTTSLPKERKIGSPKTRYSTKEPHSGTHTGQTEKQNGDENNRDNGACVVVASRLHAVAIMIVPIMLLWRYAS